MPDARLEDQGHVRNHRVYERDVLVLEAALTLGRQGDGAAGAVGEGQAQRQVIGEPRCLELGENAEIEHDIGIADPPAKPVGAAEEPVNRAVLVGGLRASAVVVRNHFGRAVRQPAHREAENLRMKRARVDGAAMERQALRRDPLTDHLEELRRALDLARLLHEPVDYRLRPKPRCG